MRYSHKYKFILINNWKCGSSSIGRMLDGYCEPHGEIDWSSHLPCVVDPNFKHPPAKEVKKVFAKKGWNFDEYIKIISVRNPWARIVSLYSYQKKKRNFSGYVKQVVSKWRAGCIGSRGEWGKSPRWNTREMMHDFDGRDLIDYVIRLENLKEDLVPIVEKHFPSFDINYDIRINTTKHKHYSAYYNNPARRIVADQFSYDIERWGYKFEEEN